MLGEMEKAKGNQHQDRLHNATDPPTLDALGISKSQSSRLSSRAQMATLMPRTGARLGDVG
jgi:hypothetical protein